MNTKDIFAQIEAMEEQMGKMYTDLSLLKSTVVQMLEENKKLSIENQQLRKLLKQDSQGEPEDEPAESDGFAVGEGYDNLARLYHEGFHICNVNYGHLRTEGECMFCLSFLNK